MAFLLLLLLPFLPTTTGTGTATATATLSADYYHSSCPTFSQIILNTITTKQITTPTTAAATLRLFFHDCFSNGCDASLLLSNTPERNSDINLSLPGDSFDVITRAKTALELSCPNTVSCSDILAATTRDLVTMVGGPYYNLVFGRKDSISSKISSFQSSLPKPNMSISQIIHLFTSKGFTVQEMVALSGAHTIGFSHCTEFSDGVFNYSRSPPYDDQYNPRFAEALQRACGEYKNDSSLSVFNDVITPNKFDNMYFKNLEWGLGLLKSDGGLFSDPRTRVWVERYAADEFSFFQAFARAMEKLSGYGVKVGNQGEVRRKCDAFNS